MGKKEKLKDPNKLSIKELLCWQGPGISSSASAIMLGYVSLYCSTVLGLSTALMGTLLMASKIVDIFTDMVIGYIVDNTNTKWGRGRPYDLCLIGSWLCTILLFSCPESFSTVAKCIWVVSIYILVNSGFNSLYAAAGPVYIVRAFNNQKKYEYLYSYGGIITMIGAIVLNMVFPILMANLATSGGGWTTLMAITAVPMIALGLTRFIFVPEKYTVDAKTEHTKVTGVFDVFKHNKYILLVTAAMFVFTMVNNLSVSTYYWTYVVGDISLMGVVSMVSIVVLPVMLFFPVLLKRFTLVKIMIMGTALGIVGYVITWFANANIALLVVAGIFTGVGAVAFNMYSGLLILECADYNEYIGKPRLEATMNTIPTLAGNFGGAFGTFIVGVLLEVSGFVTSTGGDIAAQPESAILMIRALASFVPIIMFVIGILVLRQYKLGDKIADIRAELEVRRAAAAEGADVAETVTKAEAMAKSAAVEEAVSEPATV